MKKIVNWLGLCCVVCACTVGAADLVSVSSAGGTTNYETIEAALAACSGGETLTLLGDVGVATSLAIDKRVTLDLGGHTLSNGSGQFLKPNAGSDGLVVRNGTVTSKDCCFAFQSSSAIFTVTVSNVTFNGICVLFGTGTKGVLEYQADCVCQCSYFCSSWSTSECVLNMRGGVVAPRTSVYDNMSTQGTKLIVYGGSFTSNPSSWIADGYVLTMEEHTAKGIACGYRVEKIPDDMASAEVVSADGGDPVRYTGLGGALAAATNGCTVRLLRDSTLNTTAPITAGFTLDLDGHTLECLVRAFSLQSGSAGFRVVNGTCASGTSAFMYQDTADADATVSNCTVRADSAAYGPHGHVVFVDCTLDLNYLTSYSSQVGLDIENCQVFLAQRVNDGRKDTTTPVHVRSGRFTHNMTPWLATGSSQIVDETFVDGRAYRYRVLPTAEAGTLYEAEAISVDGATTNRYATLAEAVSACVAGGTVRMLQNCTVATELAVPRSMTLDLCGLRLENQSGNFINPAAGTTLDVKDGDLYGKVSLFNVNASAATTVNATNCSIMGLCPVWGKGTVNCYNCWFRNLNQFKSGNGSATMNVYDSVVAYLPQWYDGSGPAAGTQVHVYSGWFLDNPERCALTGNLLAEGSVTYYDPLSYYNESYLHRVVTAAEAATLPPEATYVGIFYTNVVKALDNAANNGSDGVVSLLQTITRQIKTSNGGPYVFDFDGHELAVASDVLQGYGTITLRNGAIRLTVSGKSAIVMNANAKVTARSPFTLCQDNPGVQDCGIYMPGNNANLVLDGVNVSTTRLVSWGAGQNATVEVVGDGSNTCNDVYWPGTSPASGSRLVVRGGWWKPDPTAWVTNNHVVLRQASATPCGWRVRDFSKLAADGWDFDFGDPFLGATATGTVVAADPVTVKLSGTIPTKKTLLADLSGVTAGEGALAFAKDANLPNAVQVTFEDGRLYAWEAKGTFVVVR